ncbi:MAG: hypothetical protein AAGD07_11170, partial [Planctomycetota bacterium]
MNHAFGGVRLHGNADRTGPFASSRGQEQIRKPGMRKHDVPRQHRRHIGIMLILVGCALVAGRIVSTSSREGDTAFASANDRSRWATIAALVEDGTYAIDGPIGIVTKNPISGRPRRAWETIDKVRHVGADGQLHYYSSKPTLLPTLYAGVYWVLHQATGLRLTEQPLYLPRLILLLVNVPLFGLFAYLMMLIIELVGASDYAKKYCLVAACFATMATPFAITLNNHFIAVVCTTVVLWVYLHSGKYLHDSFSSLVYRPNAWLWFAAGACAAMTVAAELPALSMFCFWLVLYGLLAPRSLPPFLGGAALIVIGIFGTNVIAHQSWRTPYAHRSHGLIVENVPAVEEDVPAEVLASHDEARILQARLKNASLFANTDHPITVRKLTDGRYEAQSNSATDGVQLFVVQPDGWNGGLGRASHDPDAPAIAKKAWLGTLQIRAWDDWYDYPKSYWREGSRQGVDVGEPNHVLYAF